ncbi:MAG: outer membrane protein assembly factor BamA [Gammaproteobacteria bacterium]|nr:MAG: outer membrane protein assembly factor BamA [Pseudomonadota bacterium]PIE39000.1 MAG: outer membrane protein assembly factor BamA [Gammaproteobacteria bacterium]
MRFFPGLILFWVLCGALSAEPSFKVEDIRVEGLQRVSAGSVFSAFPVNVGDEMNGADLASAIRSLFRTGLFTDIQVSKEEGVLVVLVEERPSISKIEIKGNDAIPTGELKKGLDAAGLKEGQVFKRVTLDRLELEILRSYVAQGRYNASVEASIEARPRNRVGIKINIDEGDVASIVHINVVGNTVFSDDELVDLMQLQKSSWFSFILNDDQYSREKLSGDLERIRSYYFDRGYLQFEIESTQVSISPEMDSVFITINVKEGPEFKVQDVSLKGRLIVPEEELRELVLLKKGETFSRIKLTTTSEIISRRLGKEGYTFANVSGIPSVNEDNTTSVVFMVDPGRRAYVRRINFRGNVTTSDTVLRQEMVQMEGAVASTDLIDSSRTRLERLGFFKEVRVETPAVPGYSDLIDVNYTVEEQPSGSLSASLGYSQGGGLIIGGNVSENNFLGTGRRVSFGMNISRPVKSANFSYLNPYYTVDGVSRGFSLTARETNYSKKDISDFSLDTLGAAVTFGYPIDSFTRLSFGFGASKSKITIGDRPAQEISRYIDANGDDFDLFSVTGSWTRNTLNKGIFATSGLSQSMSIELMLPKISDLEFYKVSYKARYYYPLSEAHDWVVYLRSELGYGDGYASSDALPFFENYYSGGFGSVRGWEASSLGLPSTPHENDPGRPDPFGGNLLVEGSAELIVPIPFIDDTRSMRASFFLDAGNVFDTSRGYDPDEEEIRLSAGVSFSWLTAIAPLSFSLAKALNNKTGDRTQVFQFSLGQTF